MVGEDALDNLLVAAVRPRQALTVANSTGRSVYHVGHDDFFLKIIKPSPTISSHHKHFSRGDPNEKSFTFFSTMKAKDRMGRLARRA
jgi:hypothetical protein